MKRFLYLLILAPLGLMAQDKGIHFDHELSWQQVQAKAKAEHKYIFMDCFTTWCGPCKYMASTIFPQQEVGDFFNAKFISVSCQMDKTPGDADHIKSWYDDADKIAKDYSIMAYPTFLYFSPEGKLVHRVVGGGEAKDFMAKSANALDPSKQYYTLVEKAQQEGAKDPATLRKAALAAKDAYDSKNAALFADQYLATQKDLYTKENISFMSDFVSSSKSKYFTVFYKDGAKVDNAMGKGFADKKVKAIITQEEIYPQLKQGSAPDWAALQTAVETKYPGYAEEPIAKTKAFYYMRTNDWNNFQQAVTSYMAKYGVNASAEELNEYAWSIFENCHDNSCIEQALEWSKKSLEKQSNPMFMDTYANILYRLGKKDEAIAMETKAVTESNHDKSLQENLDKMNKGEKTWKE